MQPLFNRNSILKTLKEGLIKPNPANPDIPMWTVEDFDNESPGTKYIRECWESKPALYGLGYPGKRHENPLEEFRGMTKEEIDAKINPQFQPEEVQASPDPKDFPT